MKIMDWLFPKKEFYLAVSEGKLGLECFISEDIGSLSKPHKELIKAFLQGIVKDLEK